MDYNEDPEPHNPQRDGWVKLYNELKIRYESTLAELVATKAELQVYKEREKALASAESPCVK